MRKAGAGVPWALATVAFVLPNLPVCVFSVAEQPSTAPSNWRERFLAQAPAEYARLEARVGQWEMRYEKHVDSYPHDGTRRIVRQNTSRIRTVFDAQLGGIRTESKVIGVPGRLVDCVNPQYNFMVESEGGPLLIRSYNEPQDESRPWAELFKDYRGLEAEELNHASLLQLVKNSPADSEAGPKEPTIPEIGYLKIKSVSDVDIDGHKCIRLDGNRIWKLYGKVGTYPFWVIVDPSFHWAVRAYEQYNGGGGGRRTDITYNSAITDVAFPKRIVEEDFGIDENPGMRAVMDFEDPLPSSAVAKDFTLESLGLERPLSKAERRNRNAVLMVVINGVCLLALIVGFVLYRRAKRKRGTDVPPGMVA